MEEPGEVSLQEKRDLSPQEVEKWMQIFGIDDENEEISNK
jgi:hypothetical protein